MILSILFTLLPLAVPAALIGLFYLVRGNQAWMEVWVLHVIAPVEQCLGRFWSFLPFSAAELLVTLAGAWLLLYPLWALWKKEFKRRVIPWLAVLLWLWCGLDWMWNTAYYAKSFSQRSGLAPQPYTIEELALTTAYFAQNAAALSGQVQRDEAGHFAESQRDYFDRGPELYQNLEREFPCLRMKSVKTKPMYLWSKLQSDLGFTGVYFPFTGEANVNIDAPACLRPAVIAHEMAHQRMVASELEANFVGIAAAVRSGDTVFMYSGYLMGLMELSSALYTASPELWTQIVQTYFTPELSQDWADNHDYWAARSSPAEATAQDVYDAFLKGNGQELGILSYDACVDLLVTYFGGGLT